MYHPRNANRLMSSESELYRHPSAVFFKAQVQPRHVPDWPMFPGHQEDVGGTPSYCLPLFDVSLDVKIKSTISESFLTQHFHNPSDVLITESTYSFPLYDGATVNSFRCTIDETRVLVGKVKPKNEAQAVFKKAVAEKQAAALLQEHTPEIFEICLGNLPPKTTAKIEMVYVHELKTDLFGEGLLLTVPTSIAPRYGVSPVSGSRSAYSPEGSLKITVNVEASVPIRKLESVSHPISVEIGYAAPAQVSSFGDLASSPQAIQNDPGRARATLSDRSATLGKDFILSIVATEASLLHSQALWEPSSVPGGESAMLVSLNPRELLPTCARTDDFDGEVLLLADRSGSMADKISRLKEALSMFLNGLPKTCHFNLLSFGSSFSTMWPQSRSLDDFTLQGALAYLRAGFEADMGGTKILEALRHTVEHRKTLGHITTQIVVLTDGEVWNTEAVVDYVRQVRSELGDNIRFFALGIGDAVSHRLIEGIGAVGGGFGEVVTVTGHNEQHLQISKLLRGVLMPLSWNCQVMLEESLGMALTSSRPGTQAAVVETRSNKSQSSRAPSVTTLNYVTAPYDSSALHPYVRRSIFFLLGSSIRDPPAELKVRVGTPSSTPVEISISVTVLKSESSTTHILAAKAALRDLESGSSWMHRSSKSMTTGFDGSAESPAVAREAERLGVTYGITSRWTTFVATESMSKEETEARTYKAKMMDLSLLTLPVQSESTHPVENLAKRKRISSEIQTDIAPSEIRSYMIPLGAAVDMPSSSPSHTSNSQCRMLPGHPRVRTHTHISSFQEDMRFPEFSVPPVHTGLTTQQRMLWFQGTTKSENLSTAQTLDQEFTLTESKCWNYLYLGSADNMKSAAGFAIAVVHDLAGSAPSYRARLAEALLAQPSTAQNTDLPALMLQIESSFQTDPIEKWRILVLKPVRHISSELQNLTLAFIVAALDECLASDVALVVQMLWELSKCSTAIDVRILITSIPTEAVRHAFSQIPNADYLQVDSTGQKDRSQWPLTPPVTQALSSEVASASQSKHDTYPTSPPAQAAAAYHTPTAGLQGEDGSRRSRGW